MNFMDL